FDYDGPVPNAHELQWLDASGTEMDPDMLHDPQLLTLQTLRPVLAALTAVRAETTDTSAKSAEPSVEPAEPGAGSVEPGALVIFHGGLNPQPITPALPAGARCELVWDSSWNRPEMVIDSANCLDEGEFVTEALSVQIYLVW